MGLLIIVAVVVAGLFVGSAVAKAKQQSALGLRYDAPAGRMLARLPFAIARGHEVEVEHVMAGVRHGRQIYVYELELERHEGGREIERDFTAVVIAISGPVYGDVASLVSVERGIEAVEVIDGFVGIFLRELPKQQWNEALQTADAVLATLSLSA